MSNIANRARDHELFSHYTAFLMPKDIVDVAVVDFIVDVNLLFDRYTGIEGDGIQSLESETTKEIFEYYQSHLGQCARRVVDQILSAEYRKIEQALASAEQTEVIPLAPSDQEPTKGT
jgi:hypothetical protein